MRQAAGPPGPRRLSDSVVSALLEAGLSRATVQAMETWKAQEVLDLLRSTGSPSARCWAAGPPPVVAPLFAPGVEPPPHATL